MQNADLIKEIVFAESDFSKYKAVVKAWSKVKFLTVVAQPEIIRKFNPLLGAMLDLHKTEAIEFQRRLKDEPHLNLSADMMDLMVMIQDHCKDMIKHTEIFENESEF